MSREAENPQSTPKLSGRTCRKPPIDARAGDRPCFVVLKGFDTHQPVHLPTTSKPPGLGFLLKSNFRFRCCRTAWIDADEYGEPEHVTRFVLRCAEAFDLKGVWRFCWSLTCSKPRIEVFGGGGFVLDLKKRETVASIDCADWLAHHMAEPGELAEHRQQEDQRENGPQSQ